MQIQSATRVLCVAIALHSWRIRFVLGNVGFVGMRLDYLMILGFNIIEGYDFLLLFVCAVAASVLYCVVLVASGR